MYHRLQRHIEAQTCIIFTAYKVYKELERQLHIRKAEISANRAIEIAFEVPNQNNKIKKLILLTEEQKYFASLFGIRLGCPSAEAKWAGMVLSVWHPIIRPHIS